LIYLFFFGCRLSTAWVTAYILGKPLAGVLATQITLRSIEHGVCPATGMALVAYALSGAVTEDYARLERIAKVGVDLLELR
jgi:hypothetical protein